MAEGIAVEGLRLCKEYLPRAYRNGGDLEARANMLAAAAMGATAFQKGLGAIHALSHPVGALYNTHHGLTNAVFMPYVLDFNREALWDKIDRLAAWLGIEGGFPGFLDFVLRFRRDLGIPHTLDRIGVDDAPLRGDGGDGGGRPDRRRQPAPPLAADALDLYQRALDGAGTDDGRVAPVTAGRPGCRKVLRMLPALRVNPSGPHEAVAGGRHARHRLAVSPDDLDWRRDAQAAADGRRFASV